MNDVNSDLIAFVAEYRGVGIHDQQSEARIEQVVKPAIDQVHKIDDAYGLAKVADDVTWPPEARLFAAAKIEAVFEIAADERAVRPNIDLLRVRACVAGVESQGWRSPFHYCSLLDPHNGAAERETVLMKGAKK